ncbi:MULTISPECIES: electron transfer flavoprotein subunit beta/FixA family protein [Paenibacillus]|uniref:electron transfer flavoprotein subunit beta/FixA family protein n=1 Tax=Paenibacillus TaxID=44249 RepID=UPI002040938C|nr:electron transfer flavoprotein subunit beta/FixA family protein [Paenibacillus camelliae]MCM3634201.1 electron transfer flavoprotein subunit beta/FixA family protein [Paenibacillus camelliae]
MKIIVLMKQTFDTEEKVEITNGMIEEHGAKFVINPYDEYALEEALRIKEQNGAEVIAITVGPERSSVALRTGLALGIDQAIMICDAEHGDHSYRIAALLAEVIKPLKPDLILAGLFAVDSGSGSVALQVAQLLQLPHASAAVKLRLGTAEELLIEDAPWSGTLALVDRDVEGDVETVVIPLPAVVTAQQGLNDPRYPSLPGIMKAKKKAIIERYPSELLAEVNQDDLSSSLTVRTALFPPSPRSAGKRLSGDGSQQTKQLLHSLIEANIIQRGGN